MIVYLIGFMGSGKTSIGKRLASRLNWDFADLDWLIEEKEGRRVDDIFNESGEAAFRKSETELLRQFLPGENTIIACGGGTPCYFDNMVFMNENGLTIYIKMDVLSLKNRLVNARKERPLIADIPEDQLVEYLTEKLAEREKYYSQSKIIYGGLNVNIDSLVSIIQEQGLGNPN